MAERTSAAAVKNILLRQYDSINNPSLAPFIATASVIVDDLVARAALDSITFTDAKLELLERWIAAHCYKMGPDQQESYKQTGNAAATFGGKLGEGFKATKFGQMAISLDTSGLLEELGKEGEELEAGMDWLGKNPSSQTPYYDRS